MPDENRLTVDECYAKAAECLDLANRATVAAHRAMLMDMAQRWQQRAEDLEKANPQVETSP
jgi:hypothetical protein